jgi:rSAM/selenodomain-associated transferase 1
VRGWLVVFAKEAVPGHVKTRLSPPFSPSQAAAFYRCLLDDVLEETSAAAVRLALDATLAVDPPGATGTLAARAPAGFRAIAQAPGDLGARMAAVAQQAAAAGAPFALLRGSDSPCLGRAALGDAVAALSRADLAISADRDGGYNLVGLGLAALAAAADGRLFDHPMSTPSVLRDTESRARAARLRIEMLAPGFDVDRFDDLRWLDEARRRTGCAPCRRSIAFLDEQCLWPDRSGHVAGMPR